MSSFRKKTSYGKKQTDKRLSTQVKTNYSIHFFPQGKLLNTHEISFLGNIC